MSNICVLIIMGLPGSGKTTLSKYFIKTAEQEYRAENAELIYVCYDELARHVYKTKDYKEFRNQAFDYVEHNLKQYLPVKNKKIIFIIDDIMYFRSMRRKYYNLCRKYGLSYCQAFIKIDYHIAICRNSMRRQDDRYERILPESIFQIDQKLEVPSSEPWERFSCEITAKLPFNGFTTDLLWDTIKSAMLCPVESILLIEKRSEEGQSEDVISHTHKIDIILRKFISTHIAEIKKKNPDTNISVLGKELSFKKKEFMGKMRFENLNLNEPHTKDVIKFLFQDFIS